MRIIIFLNIFSLLIILTYLFFTQSSSMSIYNRSLSNRLFKPQITFAFLGCQRKLLRVESLLDVYVTGTEVSSLYQHRLGHNFPRFENVALSTCNEILTIKSACECGRLSVLIRTNETNCIMKPGRKIEKRNTIEKSTVLCCKEKSAKVWNLRHSYVVSSAFNLVISNYPCERNKFDFYIVTNTLFFNGETSDSYCCYCRTIRDCLVIDCQNRERLSLLPLSGIADINKRIRYSKFLSPPITTPLWIILRRLILENYISGL